MENNLGVQPLDALLESLGFKNDTLVKASTEQLTHRQVQKARKGRRITPNVKGKILRALNNVADKKEYLGQDLFNY